MEEFFFGFFILGIVLFVVYQFYLTWQSTEARRKGIYPSSGKGTLFDVKRLLNEGEKSVAVKVYQDIYKTNRKEALKAVEEMEKNMKR